MENLTLKDLKLTNSLGSFCINRSSHNPLWNLYIKWINCLDKSPAGFSGNANIDTYYGYTIHGTYTNHKSKKYFHKEITLEEWYDAVKKPKDSLIVNIL